MNFLTILNNQIDKQKREKEENFRIYYFHPHYSSREEYEDHKNFLKERILNIHTDNADNYIENTILFKDRTYDKDSFLSLKDQFIDHIIDNEESTLQHYQNQPIEIVLASYFHYIKNNINQKQLFQFIETIIKNNNQIEFLNKFAFIPDYDMHSFVISFIEKKQHENNNHNFFKKIYNYFFYSKKNNISKSLFTDLFYEYLNNQMYESATLFADKFSNKFLHLRIHDTLDLIKAHNIYQNFYKFSILSSFNINYSFDKHIVFISEYLESKFFKNTTNFYFNNEDFNFKNSCDSVSQNNLYKIYNNIIYKKMLSNRDLDKNEIILLMQIYCLSNNLFSAKEHFFILNYLKNDKLFIDIINKKDNLNIVFIFFSLYNDFDYLEPIIQKDITIIESMIFANYNLLNKNVYNVLIKYSNLDTLSIIFKKILNNRLKNDFFNLDRHIHESIRDSIQNSILTQEAEKIFSINISLFESLIDEDNKAIFEKVYIKNNIENF